MKKKEIDKVIELTSATLEQINLHDDGYWSRAYVVNGGEQVVKFPKHDTVSYEDEARFLNILCGMTLPVNTQRVKWLAEDKRCLALFGVKGTPLSKINNLNTEQKHSIGKQIGGFLKQLHSLKTDFGGQNLDGEINEYKNIYAECAGFYAKHFSEGELAALDNLMNTRLPAARKALGEKLVFSHADIWEPNILLDDSGKVGIIDCANAGYFDEAADFCVEDEALRGFILDAYGASECLRKKVELKYDMSIITCPKFGIPLWGEEVIIEKWVPLIRNVISKYKEFNFSIEKVTDATRAEIVAQIIESWGSCLVVSRGKLHDTRMMPGFAAIENKVVAGYIMYNIEGGDCEIAVLESLRQKQGIGAALINAVIAIAKGAGCRRVWLTTTNSNINAIRFYQKFGFTLKAVHINAMEEARKLKPQIPLEWDGIPIAHEFEFEIIL